MMHQQNNLGRRSIWMTCILLSLALFASACGESGGGGGGGGITPPDGDIDAPDSYGDTCIDDADACIDGMECFSYGSETADRFCTMQCANNDSCPEGSACLSLNAESGLIKLCVPNDLCIDPDGDDYGSGPGCKGPDCDQTNKLINPGAPELCDGIDNNCDGLIDNDTVDSRETCDTGLQGVCSDGWYVCRDASLSCEPNIQPGERQEICDGLDNDCDGLVDESVDEDSNYNYVTGIGRHCGNPDDECYAGTQICNSEKRQLECSDPVEPKDILDLCTGRDDNCNGEVDEDANDPNNLLGTPCYAGIGTCRAAATWSCDPNDPAAEPVCPAVARDENAQPEVCDYTDNDCDGIVDNGFVDADGVYDQIENCGQCGNNCNERFGGTPASMGLSVTCEVSGTQAQCASECLPGFYDLDKVPANGCEFQPDLDAIYVAKEIRDGTQGEDNGTCGTFDAPCRTVAHAISRASSASKPRVRVAEGIFKEGVTLTNGISVMGGHSSRNWILDPTANTTTLQGGIALGAHVTTVHAESITSATEFSGFTIDARDAQPGGNSYGIYIKDSNNHLTVKDNIVIAGRGGVGSGAGNGESGSAGAYGEDGQDRSNHNATCSHSTNPPLLAGGTGGENSCGSADTSGGSAVNITRCPNDTLADINTTSTTGATGRGGAGGAGGVSSRHTERSTIVNGVYGCESGAGVSSPGLDGGAGNNGSAGNSGSGSGSVAAGHWQGGSGGPGGSGTHGSGGGGAGSSGGAQEVNGAAHYGPTGGGGGAGGCGGNGGQGAHAGGASFGIFVAFGGNTSNVPVIQDNEITRGLGGRGGTGGAGGAGGSGGAGGEGGEMIAEDGNWTRCGQNGQRGGTGGAGGHGGGGGGGAGGASFDIATGGNSNNAVNAYQGANTYTQSNGAETGGEGGAGGTSIGNAGTQGVRGASGNFRRF